MDGTGVTLDTHSSCEIKQNLESVALSTMKGLISKYYRNNWGEFWRRFYRLVYSQVGSLKIAGCTGKTYICVEPKSWPLINACARNPSGAAADFKQQQ